MTTNTVTSAAPFAVADSFLEGLARQDFAQLEGTLAGACQLRALLPPGAREWAGGAAIAGQFATWFGETEEFELTESSVGNVGGRLHMRWRLRLRAARLGAGWFTVEQQVYADADDDGCLVRLDLLCTGYRAEAL